MAAGRKTRSCRCDPARCATLRRAPAPGGWRAARRRARSDGGSAVRAGTAERTPRCRANSSSSAGARPSLFIARRAIAAAGRDDHRRSPGRWCSRDVDGEGRRVLVPIAERAGRLPGPEPHNLWLPWCGGRLTRRHRVCGETDDSENREKQMSAHCRGSLARPQEQMQPRKREDREDMKRNRSSSCCLRVLRVFYVPGRGQAPLERRSF